MNNIFNKLKQKLSGEPAAVPVAEVAEKTASTVYQVCSVSYWCMFIDGSVAY